MIYIARAAPVGHEESIRILEETLDLARLGVDVDVQVSRRGRQAGDGLDVGGEGVPVIVFSVD